MGVLVVIRNESYQLVAKVGFGDAIRNPQSLALQNTEPLFHLVHPGTVHRRMREVKPGMGRKPHLDLLACMHPEIIQDDMNPGDLGRDLRIEEFQKLDELDLPFAFLTLTIDLAGTGIKRCKQVEGPLAPVLLFHPDRLIGTCGKGRRPSRAWLQGGFLIDTQDHLVRHQRPGLQVADGLDGMAACFITRHFGTQPGMLAPRFQAVMRQHSAHGLQGDLIDHVAGHQLAGDLNAIPLGQGTASSIRQLTGDLDRMESYRRGKKLAGGHNGWHPTSLGDEVVGIVAPIYGRSGADPAPAGPWR